MEIKACKIGMMHGRLKFKLPGNSALTLGWRLEEQSQRFIQHMH